jgi:chemotaxis protein MotB
MMKICLTILCVGLCVIATGCSQGKLIAQKDQQIATLQNDIGELERQLETQAQLNKELEQALSDYRNKEKVWMTEKEGMMEIVMDGSATFASGSTKLTAEGKKIIDSIWNVLKKYPDREILIEGHTDNVQIAERFQWRMKSNWELSSGRAHSVLHYVRDKYGTDPERIAAVGYGEHRPIADNSTEMGRAKNRRVVITVGSKILKKQGAKKETL